MEDQKRNKLEEELKAYAEKKTAAFHMPGHKRVLDPLFAESGLSAYNMDITEIPGFDDLHHPEGILKEEMEAAARLYQAKAAYFSTNGSTGAILAGMTAALRSVPPRLLIERGCHRAVYHAAELLRAELHFIEDGEDPASMSAERFEVDLIVLTSPSYEGIMKDVEGFALRAKESGALLYVDAAHGAHLGFHPAFPRSAVLQGADLVNVSLHKTLPAMTQTALLLNVSGRVSDEALRHYTDVFVSSSPSYLLMASMTAALHLIEEQGEALFSAYAKRLFSLRKALAEQEKIRLIGGAAAILIKDEYPPFAANTKLDPGKLLLDAGSAENALRLAEALREMQIECEWVRQRYILLMTSIADTAEMYERLLAAL